MIIKDFDRIDIEIMISPHEKQYLLQELQFVQEQGIHYFGFSYLRNHDEQSCGYIYDAYFIKQGCMIGILPIYLRGLVSKVSNVTIPERVGHNILYKLSDFINFLNNN